MANKPLYFDQFSKRLGDLAPTFEQVAKFASHFVDLSQPKSLNWDEFRKGVSAYEGDDLTLDRYNDFEINRDQTVGDLVKDLVVLLLTTFEVLLMPAEIDALTKTIEDTFTNLREAQRKDWADFTKTGSKSSWEYRVHFGFPDPNLTTYFYAFATTIKLGAEVADEGWWFNLTTETQSKFVVKVDSMRLIVKKGFKDPKS